MYENAVFGPNGKKNNAVIGRHIYKERKEKISYSNDNST